MADIKFIRLEQEAKDDGQRLEIYVEVSADDVTKTLTDFYSLMAHIKHFDQPSKEELVVSLELAIGKEELRGASRDFLLNRFTTAAVNVLNIDSVLTPSVHAESFPKEGESFSFVANIVPRPTLSLSSTEPVKISHRVVTVDEHDIDEQLSYTAQQFAKLKSSERQILAEGDWALMDVDMQKNGKSCKELSGIRRIVQVAEGFLPEGFIAGIIGMSKGDIRKINFQVFDSLSNANCIDVYEANVVLHDIQVQIVPTISDEWVSKNLPQFGSVDGFRCAVRGDLERQKQRVERQETIYQVRAALEKRLRGTIPDEMYQEAKESLFTQISRNLESQGSDIDSYCKEHEIDKETFNMNIFLQASEYLRQNLALDVLACELGLQETEGEIAAEKMKLPDELSGLSEAEFTKRGFRKSLGEQIRREKCLEWLMRTAAVE